MAVDERVDSFIHTEAVDAEHKHFLQLLETMMEKMKEVSKHKIELGNAKSVSETVKSLQQLYGTMGEIESKSILVAKAAKDLSTAKLNEAKATKEAAAAALNEAKAKTESAKADRLKQQEADKSARSAAAQSKAAADAENDYKQLSKAYDEAALKAKNYAIALGESHPQTVQAVKDANELGNYLKRLDGSVGQFQRNVGNYSGAVKTLEKAMFDVKKKIDELNSTGKANASVIAALEKEYSLLDNIVSSQANGFISMRQEIKSNEVAIQQLSRVYGEDSDVVRQLIAENGKLRDSFADLQAQQKALGSDTFVFDGLLQSGQALAGMYGAATGAAALFGDESEDLQKQMVKLQAVMAVVQGVQAAVNALQKEGAAVQLLLTLRSKAQAAVAILQNFVLTGGIAAKRGDIAATVAQTAATNAQTTATRAATVGAIGLRAALIATGIGAILVLLVSAASAMGAFGDSTEDATINLEKLSEEVEYQNGLLESNIAFIKQNTSVRLEQAKQAGKGATELFKISQQGLKDEQKALDENIKQRQAAFDKRFQAFDKLLGDESDAAKKQRSEIMEINKKESDELDKLRAQSRSLDYEGNLDAEREKTRIAEEGRKSRDAYLEASIVKLQSEGDAQKRLSEDEKQNLTGRLSALKNYYAIQERIINEQAAKDRSKSDITSGEIALIEQRRVAALKNSRAESRKQEEQLIREENNRKLAINFELQKLQLDQSKKTQEGVIENENQSLETRLQALQQFTSVQKQLIEGDYNYQRTLLSQKAASDEEYKLLEAQKDARLVELAANTQQKILDITKASNEKLQQESANLQDKIIQFLAAPKVRDVQSAQQYSADVQALNQSLQQKKISVEEYERQRAILQKQYSKEGMESELETIQALITYKKSIGASTIEDEIKLANLQKEISDDLTEYRIENEKKVHDLKKQLAQDTLNLIETVVLAGYDRERNAIQEKMDAIDRAKENEIAAINVQALTAEEKAARVTLAEKKFQSEKERLAREEKKIEVEKAKAEKLAALLKISIETATKVFQIKAQAAALLSNPVTAAYAPIALSQIPLVIASGAIAAALVAAKPIPKFKFGRDDGPATMAVVGDGGKAEVIELPSGISYLTPDTDTLTYLPEHAKVYPDIESFKKNSRNSMHHPIELGKSLIDNDRYMKDMLRKMEKSNGKVVNAIENIPGLTVINTWEGTSVMKKRKDGWDKYIDDYVKS